MRRALRIALLGLVLVIVAFSSALMAMRFAIHGREVKVPQLAGLSQARAETLLADSGLLMETADRFYSSEVAAGSIVSQVPQSGVRVRRGWRVRVAVSLGLAQQSVPNVLGQSGRAGEINVRRRGLELGTVAVAHLPGLPPDQVVAESPPPNTAGLTSPKVNLLVTAPEQALTLVMPDFIGHNMSEAVPALQQAGLRLGNMTAGGDKGERKGLTGSIVRQSPPAGQKVSPGTIVIFELSQ